MSAPNPGDRRPREGRCERCDRPLSDIVIDDPEMGTEWPALDQPEHCPGGILCGGPSVDWRARALDAERDRDLMQSFWRAALAHGHAAADGKPEPRGDLVGTDAELNLYAHVEAALAEAYLDGARHGLLAAAWRVDAEVERESAILARTSDPEARTWWDGGVVGTGRTLQVIHFLADDAQEADRDD